MEFGKKRFGIKTVVVVAAVSVLIGVAVTTNLDITQTISAQDFWTEPGVVEKPSVGPGSFAALAKELMPAVVNIATTHVIKDRSMQPPAPSFPFEDFFGEDFFKDFGGPEREFKRQSLGSGFIINKEGYILTNNHVIENATEILITLSHQGKREFEAEVVGKDKNLDIALIKIDADEDLPVTVLGDSDELEIGEWVVAIGNPFGLGGTVTAGIVSQKGRIIGAGPYDDFIQTDASINPGNSGGPLFNLKGEVVGINTAIYAGAQGLGFAAPINMVKNILLQLRDEGKVTRGWIGVGIQEVSPEIAEFYGMETPKGAIISSIKPGDPAEKAGLKPGDIIIEFDGKAIDDVNDLPRVVAAIPPDRSVDVKILRDGGEKTLVIVVSRKRDGEEEPGPAEEEETVVEEKLGMRVDELTEELARRLGIDETDGVIVSAVAGTGPAATSGFRRGDLIKEINGNPVKDLDAYREAVKEVEKGDILLFLVYRGDSAFFVALKVEE